MNVTLTYFGQLRRIAGVESESVEAPDGAAAQDVLKDLAARHDGFGGILFAEDGALRPSVMLLVNDAPVAKDQPIPLGDGDQVKLLPAIAGG